MTDSQRARKIAIVGLPNTGKSLTFNILTGDYTPVANYPLTTVEMKKTACEIGGQPYEVIDTPGLHCLYIHSEEELQVRDMIFSEKPDVIIQCIDANRIKQSLVLTADLLELGTPMVVSLNAIDETTRKGIWIDSSELSRLLGVPVVEQMALQGRGSDELRAAIPRARPGKCGVQYGDVIERGIAEVESKLPDGSDFRRKIAVLSLLRDPFLADQLKKNRQQDIVSELATTVNRMRRRLPGNMSRVVNNARSRWIDDVVGKIVRRQKVAPGETSKVVGHLCRHPVFGIPILLGVVFTMYLLVVFVANGMAGWLNEALWVPTANGMNSIMPDGFWRDFLVGEYGVLSLGLANAFLTVLPILSVFFLAFNVLEDIGYIPNLCVLTKRIFAKLGLSGSAVLPLVLGFGCKTMATLTTKSLQSKRERFIAVYLIAFAIPCSAQMAINTGVLGKIGVGAVLITFSVLLLVELAAGVVLNRLLEKQEEEGYIQELPPMRTPNTKAILVKTYYRLLWFIKEATPVFVCSAAAMFVLDAIGALDVAKQVLAPMVQGWLGLPLETVDAFILCLARREVAAGFMMRMVEQGQLDYIQCIVAVTMLSMFAPCLANVVAIVKELGAKVAFAMAMAINVSAILAAGCLRWTLVAVLGT
ncbi:ferrous iron transport protein B [Verrucomicrobiota bacterium]